jgi:histidyl-tRNA synthetase
MSQASLMQDVEVIRVCEQACRKQFQERFELRVSSTEILDAIFEECNVELQDRLPLMRLLAYIKNDSTSKLKQTSRQEFDAFKSRFNFEKLLALTKIRGTCEQVEN